MDPGFIILLLAGIAALTSWIIAGFRSHKQGGSKGLLTFFLNLFGSFLSIFILWLIIVYPVLDCKEFLCGLGELIIWFFSSLLLFLVWPIILILYFNKKYGLYRNTKTRQNEDLLDDNLE